MRTNQRFTLKPTLCAATTSMSSSGALDITWLRDESLEDMDNLPAPEIIAREIVEDLTAALTEFEAVAAALEAAAGSSAESMD